MSEKAVHSRGTTPISAQHEGAHASAASLLPSLSDDEQLNADLESRNGHEAPMGARVFARYLTAYYPAVVCNTDAFGRYNVFFMDDRFRRTVPNDGVFPLAWFAPGMKAMASQDLDRASIGREVELVEGPSMKDASEWTRGVYKVRDMQNAEEFEVVWTQFYLRKDDAVAFKRVPKEETSLKADASEGTRSLRKKRATKTAATTGTTEQSSGSQKRLKRQSTKKPLPSETPGQPDANSSTEKSQQDASTSSDAISTADERVSSRATSSAAGSGTTRATVSPSMPSSANTSRSAQSEPPRRVFIRSDDVKFGPAEPAEDGSSSIVYKSQFYLKWMSYDPHVFTFELQQEQSDGTVTCRYYRCKDCDRMLRTEKFRDYAVRSILCVNGLIVKRDPDDGHICMEQEKPTILNLSP